MTRGKWKFAALVAAVIFIAFGTLWYFESPAWTLKEIADAARTKDADVLNGYVDYPALRESLKAQIRARMISETQKDRTGLGAIGLAFGSAMAGPLIDSLVSPAGMQAALIASRDTQTTPAASALRVPDEPVVVRRSFSEFLVTSKRHPNGGLLFKRHGLSWKLSGVELPRVPS